MNNKYSKELMHFSLGEIFSGHKWIRREENTGGQKSKFRYWYDNAKNTISNVISSFSSAWRAGVPKSVSTAATNYQTKVYNTISSGYSFLDSIRNRFSTKLSSLASVAQDTFYRGMLMRTAKIADVPTSWRGYNDPFPTKIAMNSSDYGIYVPNASDHVKYVGKIKMDDGTTKYYYTQSAFKRGCEIYKYQSNEPSFMKNLKEVDSENPPTVREDTNVVNPGHGKEGKERTINCVKCTIAYELRRRGYDVQAPDATSGNRDVNEFHDAFGIQTIRNTNRTVKIDGTSTITTLAGAGYNVEKKDDGYYVSSKFTPQENNSIKTVNVSKAYKENNEAYSWEKETSDATANSIISALQEKFDELPSSSRGDIVVWWTYGSGHSMVWEKDQNGNAYILDTQSDTVIYDSAKSTNEHMVRFAKSLNATRDIELYRYDDLQIQSKEILDWVEEKT